MFDPNAGFLYLIVSVIIVFVVAESVYFMRKAWKRAIQLGIGKDVLKKTVISSSVFTIAPAVAILLGVIALSKALGLPFPWLRLSVIGALTYETAAAATAASAQGYSLSNLIIDPKVFSAIAWVMTLGIMVSPFTVTLFGKKIESGVLNIRNKDQKWGEIFMSALFLGMISAFLGLVFAKVGEGLTGWIPVFVMAVSMLIMSVCGVFVKILKWKWLENYALPVSMLGAMALSIPITSFVHFIL